MVNRNYLIQVLEENKDHISRENKMRLYCLKYLRDTDSFLRLENLAVSYKYRNKKADFTRKELIYMLYELGFFPQEIQKFFGYKSNEISRRHGKLTKILNSTFILSGRRSKAKINELIRKYADEI